VPARQRRGRLTLISGPPELERAHLASVTRRPDDNVLDLLSRPFRPAARRTTHRNDGITLCPKTPAAVNDGEIAVASNEELRAAPLGAMRLLALWNALPGVEKRKKVGDRDALIDQLWSAIEVLPDPEPQPDPKPPSKQDVVIAMLRLPEGATIDEVASVTGWQRHTVRGGLLGNVEEKARAHSRLGQRGARLGVPHRRASQPMKTLIYDALARQHPGEPSWTSASGRLVGGKPFSRGALYQMLQNRTYLGKIVHKGQFHRGEHTPIIDQPLWDAVQEQLAGNTARRQCGRRTRQPSLLAGMMFDGDGNRMTPSHAGKNGAHYRYYVSGSLITKDRTETSAGLRIPAVEIEHLVSSRLHGWLLDPGSIYKSTWGRLTDASTQQRLVARAADIGRHWPELPVPRKRAVLTALIERIEVRFDQIDIHLHPLRLCALLDPPATPSQGVNDDEIELLSVPVRLRRAGREIRMVINGTGSFAAKPDARLIKLLLRARRFNATLADSEGVPFAALAEREGVSRSYFTRLVRLSYLAPDITQAILDGRQPSDLTSEKLLEHSRLPLVWHDQRIVLGFA
jgi:hypothetical protein